MMRWFSLSRWENYCLLAIAAVALLIVVGAQPRAHAASAAAPVVLRTSLSPRPRASEAQWVARHQKIVARAAASAYDVMLLGDSITQGWDYNKGTWDAAFPGIRALNAGISSDGVEHVLWRTENGLFAKAKPRAVVLLAGINDLATATPQAIAKGVSRTVQEIRTRSPDTRVLVLGVFPMGEAAGNPRRAKIARVNSLLAGLEEPGKVRFLDIGSQFLDDHGTLPRSTAFDGLHLTKKGYEAWAKAMGPALMEMLGP